MTIYTNSCEGGTNGVAVTNANSGGDSGTGLSLSPSGTSALVFSSSAASHGSIGHRYTIADNTAVFAQGTFTPASRGALAVTVRFSSLPSSGAIIAGMRSTTGWMAQLRVTSAGEVQIRNASTTLIATMSGTVTAGTWYRFELAATAGTGTGDGRIEATYRVDGAGSAVDSYDSATVNAGTASAAYARFGVPQAQTGNAATIDVDSMAWGDVTSGFIGAWATNQDPTVDAGANQTVASGSTVNLTAVANDPDGSIASYAWTVDESPGAAPTITGSTSASASFTASSAGRYVLRCTVTDNGGATADDTMTVWVPTSGEALPIAAIDAVTETGTWTLAGGEATDGAALADAVDTTYIESPTVTGTAAVSRIRLNPSAARGEGTITVRVQASDSGPLSLTVRLYEGSTLRKTWTGVTVTTSWADVDLTLSTAEALTVGSWNELAVEFSVTS